jgi:hypothetical protein
MLVGMLEYLTRGNLVSELYPAAPLLRTYIKIEGAEWYSSYKIEYDKHILRTKVLFCAYLFGERGVNRGELGISSAIAVACYNEVLATVIILCKNGSQLIYGPYGIFCGYDTTPLAISLRRYYYEY